MRARNVLLIGILGVVFLGGCDKGNYAPVPDGQFDARIERKIDADYNVVVHVWAQKVERSTSTDKDALILSCPCFFGSRFSRNGPIMEFPEGQLEFRLLPGAEYTIDITSTKK